MVFSSMIFLWFFLPIVLGLYFFSNDKFKNTILLISSLLFYTWGGGINHLFLIIFSILINYLFGILINKYRKYDKVFLIFAIIANLGLLGYFKYFNFIVNCLNRIFTGFNIGLHDIVLPIGISFYTFQILSYIIDLYKKEIKVQKNIFNSDC